MGRRARVKRHSGKCQLATVQLHHVADAKYLVLITSDAEVQSRNEIQLLNDLSLRHSRIAQLGER